MPLYPLRCHACGFGHEVYEPAANAPSAPRKCPACGKTASTQDYAAKRIQSGFLDHTEIVRVPTRSEGGQRVPGTRHRKAVNRREWSEMCKRNDWTDVSNSSGPIEADVPRETPREHAPDPSTLATEAQFKYRSDG